MRDSSHTCDEFLIRQLQPNDVSPIAGLASITVLPSEVLHAPTGGDEIRIDFNGVSLAPAETHKAHELCESVYRLKESTIRPSTEELLSPVYPHADTKCKV